MMPSTISAKTKTRLPVWAVIFWLFVWQIAAWLVDEPLLLVSPLRALERLFQLVWQADFWQSVLFSVGHILMGFAISAVLGVALVNVQKGYGFLMSVLNGVAGGLGFLVAIVLFASLRERVDKADCPESFKGYPIALISASLLARAFMGFSGLKIG